MHAVFVHGNVQNDHSNELPQFPGQPPARVNLNNSKGLAIGYNAVLRPNLISTARYGFTRQGVRDTGAFDVSYIQIHGDLDTPIATTRGISRILPVHQFSEDLTWIKGAHNLKFGGVIRTIRNDRLDYQNSYFSGVTNSPWLQETGLELRAPVTDLSDSFSNTYSEAVLAVMGGVSEVTAQYNCDLKGNPLAIGAPQTRKFAANEFEFYAQDTWSVTRGLTVTAGLRWSLTPPVCEQQDYQTTIIPSLGDWFAQRGAPALPETPRYTGIGNFPQSLNVAPSAYGFPQVPPAASSVTTSLSRPPMSGACPAGC